MRQGNYLRKQIEMMKKQLIKPDDVNYLIEINTEEDGGAKTYKVVNGERFPIPAGSIKLDPKIKHDFTVVLPKDLKDFYAENEIQDSTTI